MTLTETKQYSIIYADPPWQYDNEQWNEQSVTSSAEHHYPTVKLEDLKAMNVPAIAEQNSLLFMWTSSPHLDVAIELGKAWSFDYSTVGFVWDKRAVNPGYYTMSQVELCLVFKRGSIPTPRGDRNVRQFLSELRTTHSTKPVEVRDRIVRMFPTQAKIELFARQRHRGWDVWGNEAPDVFEPSLFD